MSDNKFKVSDNKFVDCPARMDDGRQFTDYRPNCYLNNAIRVNNQTYNSFQYRMFLTHNATNLMKLNRNYNTQQMGCASCNATTLPEQSVVQCNANKCQIRNVNPKGLGQGRQYSSNASTTAGYSD